MRRIFSMNIFAKIFCMYCFVVYNQCQADLHSSIAAIDSLAQAQQAFDSADEQTLIVFDVDETIIMPTDALWQNGRIWEADIAKHFPVSNQLKKAYSNCKSEDLDIFSQRMFETSFEPVEAITVSLIQDLLKKNLKVIALTNFGPGKFGTMPSLKKWRRNQLRDLGINFESSFPGCSYIFSDLAPTQGSYPEYYKGILFGANNPKGVVLGSFLDQLDYAPTKVICIDDKEKYLLSIQEELAKRNIAFEGFLYKGAEKHAAPIDLEIISYQLDHWQQNHEHVSDIQVRSTLAKNVSVNDLLAL